MKRSIAFLLCISGASQKIAVGADNSSPSKVQTAEFEHILDSVQEYSSNLQLEDGDTFNVVVKNTCPDFFKVKINGIKSAPVVRGAGVASPQLPTSANPCSAKEQISVTTKHDSKNGAYAISIERADGLAGGIDADQGGKKGLLNPVRYLLIVPAAQWSTVFSGGVGFSSLTSKKYSLGADSSGTSYTVTRNKSSEDKANAIAAAFVTVTNDRWVSNRGVKWGPSLGIGTNSGSKIQWFPGFSFIFGQYVMTFGANVGSVDSLPSGLNEGSTTTEANALNTSGTKLGVGGFISISLSFLGNDAQSKLRNAIVPAEGT